MESKGHVNWRYLHGVIAAMLSLSAPAARGSVFDHGPKDSETAPARSPNDVDDLDELSSERAPVRPASAIEEDVRATAPVRASKPSQAFVEAERAHDAGAFLDAVAKWEPIVQGKTSDDSEHRAIAEYQSGVALARLGVAYSGIHRLRAAAEQRHHPMHLPALAQLGRIAANLPELWPIMPLFSGYDLADVDRLNQLSSSEKSTLVYLVGRGLYDKRDWTHAQQAFARIDPSGANYLQARLFESACHVRMHHSVPALTSLKRGIHALERGELRVRDEQRWLDLFNLSQARIYYSSAIALDLETNIPIISTERLSAAVKYYNLLEPESEYFQEATFELAWVHFMAGQYPVALGKIFALESPYFEHDFHPEAPILKSVVYYANCNYEAVTITTARFNKRYVPIRDELKKFLKSFKSDEPGRGIRIASELHRRPHSLAPALASAVDTVYRQRAFLRMLQTIDAVEVEVAKLESLLHNSKSSELSASLRPELDAQRQAALARADQWLKGFLQRRVDEIDEHVRNGEKQLIQPFPATRNLLDVKLKSGQVSMVESVQWGRVLGDDEHDLWPFDGEYWRDELGTYRQTVLSTCGR